jgi:DNA polymerase-1
VHGTYNRRYRLDGSDYASYNRHRETFPELRDNLDGTYSTLAWEEFNIGSPKQRLQRLLELGYEPVNYTPKGNPKVDEESLIAFAESSGHPEIQAIANWLVIEGRSTMVEGWLNNVNYYDSCMHGSVLTCGARSRRMRHFHPNTANIPKAKPKIKYGKECRQLWLARPGRVLVGYDASGLEMRMFAEYLKNDEATLLFTEGDPHMNNTRNLGLADEMRDLTVKNGFYAYLYGAADPKLGKTLKPELQGGAAKLYGAEARAILEQGTPGLAKLVADINDEFQHQGGVLRTIDGGFVRCPAKNAALNYKLQSGGGILMKVAGIDHYKYMKRKGLDAFMVGNIHDEIQNDSDPKAADVVGQSGVKAIQIAGEILGCKVPFTGAYKIGNSWAETH